VNERKIVDIFVSNIMTWIYNGRVNHFYGDENIATSESASLRTRKVTCKYTSNQSTAIFCVQNFSSRGNKRGLACLFDTLFTELQINCTKIHGNV
jgi:hypothetical protein